MTDDEILQVATRARNGAKVERLLRGDHNYRSDSEADMALVGALACYTQDPEQLQRLWQASGLNRPKLRRRDYVRRTIRTAVDHRGFTYQPGPR
jgi:putative DNA primase/helicase